jgi:YD repeat-containing protein
VTIDDHGGSLARRTTSMLDAVGNLTAITNARIQTTEFKFDPLNRQTVTIDANSQRVTTLLDAANNVVEMKDQLGNTTKYVYDALNRKVVTIDPRQEAYRTTVAYDPGGYVVQLTDPSDAHTVTKFDYDALGRKIRQVEEVGSSIPATFAYDGVGLLISSTDRLGRRRDFEYDALNRMTTQVWLNTSGTPVETFTYAFDPVGNQTSAGNATHRYTMAYDSRHRVTGVQEPFSQSLAFAYDAADNRTKVEDSQGGLRSSTYDSLNRLVTIQHSGQANLRVDHTYNAVDRLETITRYSTLDTTTKVGSTTLMYDAVDRLTVLVHRDGAATPNVLAHYTYTYDNAHRLTVENLDSTLTSYSYDEANQLKWDSSATPTFTYEGAGNRTNSGYTTDAGNRLTNDGTWTYTYDAEGNLETKSNSSQTWTYEYDHRNQLTKAERTATTGGALQKRAEYKYDVYANRIEQKVDTDGDTNPDITEHYALDGWKILQGPLGDRRALRGNENWDIWADLDGLSSDALKTRNMAGIQVAPVPVPSNGPTPSKSPSQIQLPSRVRS